MGKIRQNNFRSGAANNGAANNGAANNGAANNGAANSGAANSGAAELPILRICRHTKAKVRCPDKILYVLVAVFVVLLLVGLFADQLVPNPPNEAVPLRALQAPSPAFPFGTDSYGRCVFSRVLVGIRTSLIPAIGLVIVSAVVGTAIGMISGYYGRAVDEILMRLTDLVMAFPSLLLAIFISGILGGGVKNAGLSLLCVSWTNYARLVRAFVLSHKEDLYVKAAILSGERDPEILFRHLLPNFCSVVAVTMSLQVATMMVSLAGLSFLGLGAPLPQAEWGSMISENVPYLQRAAWTVLCPCAALIFCSFLFNIMSDRLRKKLS